MTGSDCKLCFVLRSSGHILLFIAGNKSCCSFERKRPPRFTLTMYFNLSMVFGRRTVCKNVLKTGGAVIDN